MTPVEEAAALVALLRVRPQRMSWNEIAAEVAFEGNALAVWERASNGGALIADPRMVEELKTAQADVEAWQHHGLRFVAVTDHEFPQRLLDVRETPPFIFAAGELRRDDQGVSVVGSRNASERGRMVAAAAARMLVDRGLTVIAGLASGIDTVAHASALAAGGRTVAFLGTGINKYYPAENRELQQTIATRGLVLSQFWPDAPPTKQSFPMRNASMSGYGLATIVVEAGEHSGTRIQARNAVEHGRPVILTDAVTQSTTWGATLVGSPGVYVVAGMTELELAIDDVLTRQNAFDRALQGLTS